MFFDYIRIWALFLLKPILVVLIIIDFIKDILKFRKDKKAALKSVGFDIVRIVAIIIFYLVLCGTLPEIGNPKPIQRIINDKQIEKIYVSEKANALMDRIKEEYDVEVYPFVNISDILNDKNVEISMDSLNKADVERIVENLYDCLGMYNEKAFLIIPKEFYIVGDIDYKSKNVNATGLNYSSEFIVLSSDSNTKTIHHEIFHTLQYFTNYKDFKERHNLKDSCKYVSDYACTNEYEQLSESWAYSIARDNDSELENEIRTLYKKYLKGFDVDTTNINEIEYDQGQYSNYLSFSFLNDKQKQIYAFLDNLPQASFFNLDVSKEDFIKAHDAYCNDFPLDYTISEGEYYYDDDSLIFYLSKRARENNENIEEEIEKFVDEKLDSLSEYDNITKLEKIFEELAIYNRDELGYIEEFQKTQLNKLLQIFICKLGYQSINYENKFNDYLHMGVVIYYNDNFYWLDLVHSCVSANPMVEFMVDDEYYFRDGVEQKEDILKCQDPTMSYMYRHELYLAEFDEGKINKYIINKLKNKPADGKLEIVCKNKEVYQEVEDYLFKEDYRGITTLQKIYRYNIGGQVYCGYLYRPDGYNYCITVSDFKYVS